MRRGKKTDKMVTAGQMQMFNKPEPYEAQVLSKMYKQQYEYFKDDKKANAGLYKIRLHDHTLGNAVRMQLLRDDKVLFAGLVFHRILLNVFC